MFPQYDSLKEVMKPAEVLNAIINTDPTSEVVCSQKPVGVSDAAVFIVDTSKLRHADDLKADDMGSWIHKGKPIRYYEVQRSPSGVVYGATHCAEAADNSAVYRLTKIYYHHKGTSEFRKTIFYVHGMTFISCEC